LNITPRKCDGVPGDTDPNVPLPGFALARRTNAARSGAGSRAPTASANWNVPSWGERHEVLQRIERELAVQVREERGDDDRREQQRRCVGLCTRDGLSRQQAARTGLVLDDHGLAEFVLQTLGDRARDKVERAAGGEADDEAKRALGRIGEPPGARQGRQRCKSEEATARAKRIVHGSGCARISTIPILARIGAATA
jgi:hypothetical protein